MAFSRHLKLFLFYKNNVYPYVMKITHTKLLLLELVQSEGDNFADKITNSLKNKSNFLHTVVHKEEIEQLTSILSR